MRSLVHVCRSGDRVGSVAFCMLRYLRDGGMLAKEIVWLNNDVIVREVSVDGRVGIWNVSMVMLRDLRRSFGMCVGFVRVCVVVVIITDGNKLVIYVCDK